VLVLVYAAVFGALAARAYPAHETGAYDLGTHTQALWNAGQGRGLALSTTPIGSSRFAVHVEPILFLILPIFPGLSQDPRSILWLQAIVLALGGLPLFGLARRRLDSDLASLLVVSAYFLLPALESVTLFDFHAVGLAPSLMLAALYFLDQALLKPGDRRGIWADRELSQAEMTNGESTTKPPHRLSHNWNILASAFFFLLALGTKEDISLNVLVFGLYLLVFRKHWRSGTALSLVGLVWFYVATYVVIPAHRPDGSGSAYLGFFEELGDTPLEIILSPFRTPLLVWSRMVTPDTVRGIAMITLPLALFPIVGWRLLLPAVPTLAITLLSSNPLMHNLETYHYAAPAIPFMMLAAVDGMWRTRNILQKYLNRRTKKRSRKVVNLMIVLAGLMLVTSLVYHYFRGYSPIARPFHWPMITAHEKLGDALAASIPPDAPVMVQAELLPLVAHRPWVQIWQGPFEEEAEYFFLDVSHPAFVNRFGAQESFISDIAFDPSVGIIESTDGYLLLEKGAAREAISADFFSYLYLDPPADATPVQATFGDSLQLVAFQTQRNYAVREEEPLLSLYWKVLDPLPEDYLISIFLLDEQGQPVGATIYQQPLTVWWPTSRWETGPTIHMLANTFPWWTGDRKKFGYGIAVVSGDDPWDVSRRLPVLRSDGGAPPIDDGTVLPLVGFKRIAGIPYARP
jgi:uncharacterized membrane protein